MLKRRGKFYSLIHYCVSVSKRSLKNLMFEKKSRLSAFFSLCLTCAGGRWSHLRGRGDDQAGVASVSSTINIIGNDSFRPKHLIPVAISYQTGLQITGLDLLSICIDWVASKLLI